MTDREPGSKDLPPIEKIDSIIHEPGRLMIMAHLFVVDSADFLFLKQQTRLTWGNLSAHLSRLEAAGYIDVEKEFVEKKPHTILHLTEKGRTAFHRYRQTMRQMFEDYSPT
jgi:DNA-binding HxlR family transcriptional regulator